MSIPLLRVGPFSARLKVHSPKVLKSGRCGRWPAHTPLRTVRESFPSYGSSLSNRYFLVEAGGGICQPMFDDSRLRIGAGRRRVSVTVTHAPP